MIPQRVRMSANVQRLLLELNQLILPALDHTVQPFLMNMTGGILLTGATFLSETLTSSIRSTR